MYILYSTAHTRKPFSKQEEDQVGSEPSAHGGGKEGDIGIGYLVFSNHLAAARPGTDGIDERVTSHDFAPS